MDKYVNKKTCVLWYYISMEQVKIVVTVPLSHTEIVREAIGKAGGGRVGNYTFCSFSIIGAGRFKPEEGSNPFIGKQGKLESVEEERVEINCLKNEAKTIVDAIRKVHPYEEPAIDIYPLISL